MAEPGEILVVGSVNLDLTVAVDRNPQPGETLLGRSVRRSPGGKGANQAAAAARLGGRVSFAGRVGADDEADDALSLLRESGADLSLISVETSQPTGLAVVTVDRAGENSIVVIPGANDCWSPADADALAGRAARSRVLVCQGEVPPEVVDGLAAVPSAPESRFVLNLAPVIDVAPETLRRADPLVVNEHEARLALRALRAHGGSGQSAAEPDDLDEADDARVLDLLRTAGVPSVVMTRGAQGAFVRSPDLDAEIPSPMVIAEDTTGAGDAFVGALAVGLARGESLDEACRLSVRVGAAAVRASGAQTSYPWAGEALPE